MTNGWPDGWGDPPPPVEWFSAQNEDWLAPPAPAPLPSRTPLWAYIDETGDRGSVTVANSSPIYGMACVLVDQPAASRLQAAVARLRKDFGVPDDRDMSWKKDLKSHSRRKHAAAVLGAVPGVTVLFVYYRKDRITQGTYHTDQQRAYDYLAHKMHKAILWATQFSGYFSVAIRFGHVRHHDHNKTKTYLEGHRDTKAAQALVQRELKWVASKDHSESQAADLYGGFLKSAIWEDEYGSFEGSYIKTIWHQIRQAHLCGNSYSPHCAIPLGIMSMPESYLVTQHDWFPCGACKHKKITPLVPLGADPLKERGGSTSRVFPSRRQRRHFMSSIARPADRKPHPG
ncbi:hypothetical protein ARTHRO9V_130227 [Arthrobacter sp. 9V]|uniref:DUF3800 domain-containing protein n=1 Tax=Arthrobacter sp. 9V TaxID=2653132 RepID=UPI0012F2B098|nr:DUF3800 domain-containing protein [Arthrobacter sp. 9V]VXB25872.1 hypothetical protein ARTHRO9V_130227 [Arthrobacter sp. 9V]